LPERQAGAVPLPDIAPQPQDAPQVAPEPSEPAPLDIDTERGDDAWLVIADKLLGGMMPWVMASADLAAGHITEEQFDQARQTHQERINSILKNHPEFSSAVDKAIPFLEGLGIGIAKPAKTIAGTALRAGAVGAATGAAQGFSEGDVEEPSFSGKRVGGAVGGALRGSATSAAGGAMARGVTRRMEMKEEARVADLEKSRKRAKTESARMARERKKRQQMEDEQLAQEYPSYRKMPLEVSGKFADNRKLFNESPETIFKEAADLGQSIDDMAKFLKMSPATIANKLERARPSLDSVEDFRLWRDVQLVLKSRDAFKSRQPSSASRPSGPRRTAKPFKEEPGDMGDQFRGPALDRLRKRRLDME
jgi:hypothetical protein